MTVPLIFSKNNSLNLPLKNLFFQLLTKVNQRFQQQHKQDDNQTPPVKDKKIVAQLAEILKKIEPYQFRKKNEAGKDVLYFSMNRTA